MYDEKTMSSSSGNHWGIVIFFLILFIIFGGGWGNLGGSRASAAEVAADARSLAALDCSMEKNFATLTGNLDVAFREVINNNNVNTSRILDGQKDLYIKQLEQQATQLFATNQAQETRNLYLMGQAQVDRRLDSIEANMLKQPPIYPATCVPCSQNTCGTGCGTFIG